MEYGYTRIVEMSFEEALDDITMCLAEQGFGVLTKIDLQEAIKNKLDKDISRYMVLGACNPSLAYRGLQSEQEIGLLLPCNVIVYEKNAKIYVSSFIPTVITGFMDNPEIKEMTQIAEDKLKKAVDNM